MVEFLVERGLLNNKCPHCGEKGTLQHEKSDNIPRFYCPCKQVKFSCSTGSQFQKAEIRDLPLFLFIARCMCLRVREKAIQCLSGADVRTVRSCINAIREAMRERVKKEFDEGRLKLGGDGKVVKIDEMFVCHRKYHRGRRQAKEGVWVLGLTEVESASHPIENPCVLGRLKENEEKRQKWAED